MEVGFGSIPSKNSISLGRGIRLDRCAVDKVAERTFV